MSRLIDEVKRNAPELGSTAAARAAVDAVCEAIRTITADDEKVRIHGFGTFERKLRAGRTGRNPRTGEPVQIAARKALVFKATK